MSGPILCAKGYTALLSEPENVCNSPPCGPYDTPRGLEHGWRKADSPLPLPPPPHLSGQVHRALGPASRLTVPLSSPSSA
jgi:hypothetical protein